MCTVMVMIPLDIIISGIQLTMVKYIASVKNDVINLGNNRIK